MPAQYSGSVHETRQFLAMPSAVTQPERLVEHIGGILKALKVRPTVTPYYPVSHSCPFTPPSPEKTLSAFFCPSATPLFPLVFPPPAPLSLLYRTGTAWQALSVDLMLLGKSSTVANRIAGELVVAAKARPLDASEIRGLLDRLDMVLETIVGEPIPDPPKKVRVCRPRQTAPTMVTIVAALCEWGGVCVKYVERALRCSSRHFQPLIFCAIGRRSLGCAGTRCPSFPTHTTHTHRPCSPLHF